ncbi:hypothetical protein LOD99_11855 [Oopsacas minuta]|uniref:Uncharacterized protein n=1 Tax=Oopsacas minuta TaxID=111878 RepID=A0AAV7JM84_9METZ|nr:hypothetical protein LOD99_11855 [Oopsacas minuta]
MGNRNSQTSKYKTFNRMQSFEEFICMQSASAVAIDPITNNIYVLRMITTGCIVSEHGYDRLFVFSEEGDCIYNTKIKYNLTNTTRPGTQFDLHGIAFHNNLIYITNRSTRVISVITEDAELISTIKMPFKCSVYTSPYYYAYGIGLVKETRGSTRIEADCDGLFICQFNSVLAIMHEMKPKLYDVVKEDEGQTSDIRIHQDLLHILSLEGNAHLITIMSKEGIQMRAYFYQKEDLATIVTFTISSSGVYYFCEGDTIKQWDGEKFSTISSINLLSYGRNCRTERGITIDSKQRLVFITSEIWSTPQVKFLEI